jgi:hypothetical protein
MTHLSIRGYRSSGKTIREDDNTFGIFSLSKTVLPVLIHAYEKSTSKKVITEVETSPGSEDAVANSDSV